MSYLSDARAAIIAKAATIAGVTYTYSRMPETLAGSPAFVLMGVTWRTIPGDRERTTYAFTLRLWHERLGDDDPTIAAVDDLIDLVQAAYATGITLGQPAQTTQSVIRGGAANAWMTIGDTIYLTADFEIELSSTRQRGYSA